MTAANVSAWSDNVKTRFSHPDMSEPMAITRAPSMAGYLGFADRATRTQKNPPKNDMTKPMANIDMLNKVVNDRISSVIRCWI